MEFDPLEEYRGTDKERNGARVSIEMMINSAKYTPQQHLCYVCQKFPISARYAISIYALNVFIFVVDANKFAVHFVQKKMMTQIRQLLFAVDVFELL